MGDSKTFGIPEAKGLSDPILMFLALILLIFYCKLHVNQKYQY